MPYITLAELKQYLGIDTDDTGDDDKLNAMISSAQDRIEQICHRKFEHGTDDTVRYFDLRRDVRGRTVYFDADLVSITALENNGETIPATAYILEPRNIKPAYGLTLKTNSGATFTCSDDGPEDAIKITGKWAYSTSPPDIVKYVCKRLAGFYYRLSVSQQFSTIGPEDQGQLELPRTEPQDVRAALRPLIRKRARRNGRTT